MKFKHLTTQQVIDIHAELIKEFGGIHGIRDQNALESAVARPQTGYYSTIHEQAAALLESLARNHAFVDGNKRVAFFVTDTFLRINGYQIECDNEETHKYFMMLFETNSFHFHQLLDWLNSKITTLK